MLNGINLTMAEISSTNIIIGAAVVVALLACFVIFKGLQKKKNASSSFISTKPVKGDLLNDENTDKARIILKGLGGKENLKVIDSCVTRIRLVVNDTSIIKDEVIQSAGALGVHRAGNNNIQIIIGMQAELIAIEMKKLCR